MSTHADVAGLVNVAYAARAEGAMMMWTEVVARCNAM
jgi:hypothetical protein